MITSTAILSLFGLTITLILYKFLTRGEDPDMPVGASYMNVMRKKGEIPYKKQLPWLIIILLSVSTLWVLEFDIFARPTKNNENGQYIAYSVYCSSVIDGDTIRVKDFKFVPGNLLKSHDVTNKLKSLRILNEKPFKKRKFKKVEKIRYLGFNSPDPGRNHDPSTKEIIQRAYDATSLNNKLVGHKRNLILMRSSKSYRDRHGRILAYVYADFNEEDSQPVYSGVSQHLLDKELGNTRYGSPDSKLPLNLFLKKK